MLLRALHITSSFYVFVLPVYFDWLYLFEMTRPKKSTTTTSPLKSQDALNKASKSDSGAEVEGTKCEEYVTLAILKQMLSMQESTLKSISSSASFSLAAICPISSTSLRAFET